MINSNLGPISHRLATIHLWRTDGRTTSVSIDRFLLKYSLVKTFGFWLQLYLWHL